MECYECSVEGEEIVHMNLKKDDDQRTVLAFCPNCGCEEVIGFGI